MNDLESKNNQQFDNWLLKQVKADESYLDDDGFSDRVVRALPAEKPKPLMDNFAIYTATIVSSTLVAWVFPSGEILNSILSVSVSLTHLLLIGSLFTFTVSCWAVSKLR